MLKKFFLLFGLILSILLSFSNTYAQYRDKEAKTQVNKKTTYFEDTLGKEDLDPQKLKEEFSGSLDSTEKMVGNEGKAFESLTDSMDIKVDEVSENKSELENIGAHDLDDAGVRKMQDTDLPENMFLDNSEGAMLAKYEEAAEEIGEGTEKLLGNLMGELKKLDIDCKTTKGDKIQEPQYLLEGKERVVQESTYDAKFCEQLKNKYNCREVRIVKCKHKASKPFLTSAFNTSLPVSYDVHSGILTFGWNKAHTIPGGAGMQHDYNISFNIEHLQSIHEFRLVEIGWDDHVRITINDKQVYAAPLGGDRLELISEQVTRVENGMTHSWFTGHKRVKIDSSNNLYDPEYSTWWQKSANIDFRSYLKVGTNNIKIRLIVGGDGGIWLKFLTKLVICNEWEDRSEESCNLID